MKKVTIFLISLLLIQNINVIAGFAVEPVQLSTDSIRVLSTPDLYNLSGKWISEYNKIYPGEKIKLVRVSDIKMTGDLLEQGEIGFVSSDFISGFNKESIWPLVVGRNIIVPVINSKNPFFTEIKQKGISSHSIRSCFSSSDSGRWGTLLKNSQNSTVNFYMLDDVSVEKATKEFLVSENIIANATKYENSDEMISAIRNDPYAIGFCKLTDIMNSENLSIADNISLMPIDRNDNGILDFNESIYENINSLMRGVWIGKYPKALFNDIYSISSGQPENKGQVAFLKWVISDGQRFLLTSGYSDILTSERQSANDKLIEPKVFAGVVPEYKSVFKIILISLVIIILTGLVVDLVIRYRKRSKREGKIGQEFALPKILDENSLIFPRGLYFDKTHTWSFMEQNGIVKVGIDDFLQHITGTLTRIKMKSVGDKVEKGKLILSIVQRGKQLNIYAPISGIIKETNNALKTNISVLNSSPYNEGWIYRIEPTNWSRENQLLFMAAKHKHFIRDEFSRLKDFLAEAVSANNEKYAQVILQDGGELTDNILSDLGPEVWDDFQTKFIDPSRQIWFYDLF